MPLFCLCLGVSLVLLQVFSFIYGAFWDLLRQRMLLKSRSCLLDVIWVKHICCVCLRSLQMKFVFERFGRADWWCTKSGFFSGFL